MYELYNKIICISDYTSEKLKSKGYKNIETIYWGPDLDFYKRNRNNKDVIYDFYSNGKSCMDFDILKAIPAK